MEAGVAAAITGRDERSGAAAVYHEMIRAGSEHPGFAPLISTRDRLLVAVRIAVLLTILMSMPRVS